MVKYKLLLTGKFASKLKQSPIRYHPAFKEAIQEIREVPEDGKPLIRELTEKYSWRLGVYRIIYRINKKDRTITLLNVDHRGRIYN